MRDIINNVVFVVDWPDDEGQYANTCCECKSEFYGNKGRIVCRKCTLAKEALLKQHKTEVIEAPRVFTATPKVAKNVSDAWKNTTLLDEHLVNDIYYMALDQTLREQDMQAVTKVVSLAYHLGRTADKLPSDAVQDQEELIKLRAFKAYVHQRLDDMGIPTHPDGEHSKAGCRIGDRLDVLSAESAQLINRQSELLRGVANALHGGPLENGLWSHHDLPELVNNMRSVLSDYPKGQDDGSWVARKDAILRPNLRLNALMADTEEPDKRCKHGIRLPHECRECEAEIPDADVKAFAAKLEALHTMNEIEERTGINT